MVLADKYRYYVTEVRRKKLSQHVDLDKVIYFTKDFHKKTAEGDTLDELNLTKLCCRRHMLSHVDID